MSLHGYRLVSHAASTNVGERKTARLGAGGEFADYRSYEPGDDPRFVDWNVYARSGKLFVRRYHAESSTRVYLAEDVSASMHNKTEAATRLQKLLKRFSRFDTWKDTKLNSLADLQKILPEKPGLLLIISDALEPLPKWKNLIAKFATRGFDVSWLQLLAIDEIDPPPGAWRLEDRESGNEQEADDAGRKIYLENFRQHNEHVAALLRQYGFRMARIVVDSPEEKWFADMVRARVLERGQ